MVDSRSKKEYILITQLDKGEPVLSVASNIQLSMMSGVHELSQRLNAYLKDDDDARAERVEHIRQALRKPGTMEVLDYIYKLNRCRPFALNKAWKVNALSFTGVEKNEVAVVLGIGVIYSFLCDIDKTQLAFREVRNRANLDFTLR